MTSGLGAKTGFSAVGALAVLGARTVFSGSDEVIGCSIGGVVTGTDSLDVSSDFATELGAFLLGPRARPLVMCVN